MEQQKHQETLKQGIRKQSNTVAVVECTIRKMVEHVAKKQLACGSSMFIQGGIMPTAAVKAGKLQGLQAFTIAYFLWSGEIAHSLANSRLLWDTATWWDRIPRQVVSLYRKMLSDGLPIYS